MTQGQRQRGATLIELLIAISIGLVILAGVAVVYYSSSQVSRTANQVGTAEDNSRIALFLIGDALRTAGYGEIVGSDYSTRAQTLFDGAHVRACAAGRFRDPFATPPDYTCVAGGAGDALLVRYQGDSVLTAAQGVLRTCLGNQPQQFVIDAGTYRPGVGVARPVVQSAFQINDRQQLACADRNGPPGLQPIVDQVEDFRVFFGFDDGGFAAGSNGVTNAAPLGASLRTAADIAALAGPGNDPWDYVVSVHVCVTVMTREQGVGVSTVANRCPQTAAEAAAGTPVERNVTDGIVRRTSMQVFTVRSRATASPSVSL